jgi:hypothetical protein
MPVRAVKWEGGDYVLDFVASEAARIRHFRQSQGGPALDIALDIRRLSASRDRASADRMASLADTLLADGLLSWAYAADWPESARIIRNVARRHDFGFDKSPSSRRRTVWAIAEPTQTPGVPWRLEGSILGLDMALAPLALRRVSSDQLSAPTISSTERITFVESFGMLNPIRLDDETQRVIAESIERGAERVAVLARDGSGLDEVIRSVRLDGWRTRALRWAIANDPDSVSSMFTLTEVMQLAEAEPLYLEPWGMSARKTTGCLCQETRAAVDRMALVGRPHLGLLAATVPDLHLRVAVTLNELQLPAGLAKAVIAAAAQEFADRVRPTDPDDWLTLARATRALPRERVEDYLAGVTARGPLVAQR